jgi:hypothetical protein
MTVETGSGISSPLPVYVSQVSEDIMQPTFLTHHIVIVCYRFSHDTLP